jgi:L-fucono-1,5-lactonase
MSAPSIDSHQHFWRLSRGDYGWLTAELEPIYRDFVPGDLRPLLDRAGVERTVVVQAAPTVAETRFLLDLAARTDWIAGVVGWIDMESPHAVEDLDELALEPGLCGIRPMIQDRPDTGWMLGEGLRPALRALEERNLAFDALVRPAHLPHLLALTERHADLRIVVDHGGKPDVASGSLAGWAEDMTRIARESSACCKLSGLITEAGSAWSAGALRPYVDHLLDCFGPRRLLWGSDWPVVTLAGSYEGWCAATLELLAPLDAEDRAAILGGNAVRFYGLAERGGRYDHDPRAPARNLHPQHRSPRRARRHR